ncbi:NTP transferase domain-containing protein [Ammoniphilus sp. YIM 78166]|uniref:nucleotidyltransferase family protein n=1 Tax=Ammoniphilus sp. YIM 78166 TaxID=1644106 RepID=UPI00106F47DF|nr:nucleotidyltransferase family protein [Ammoniphilus sp. YIM 78166]
MHPSSKPTRTIWGLVLAAGLSRRMGSPKLILPFEGRPMIQHMIHSAVQSKLDGVAVVINPQWKELEDAVQASGADLIVRNEQAEQGMSTSLTEGLKLLPPEADAVMVLLGDQPHMQTATIDQLVERFYQVENPIIQANYRGQKGHPVIFTRDLFPQLLKVKGDQGGKDIIRSLSDQIEWVEFDNEPINDIDTMEDYARLIGKEVRR